MSDGVTEAHKFFGPSLFNATWELIDKPDRSADDDAAMLEAAMGSLYHWTQVGEPEQVATGYWQVAHVASLLGFGLLAWAYANRSLAIAEAEGFTDWRKASVLEGVARAAAAYGDAAEHEKYYALAKDAIDAIESDDERAVIAGQFATVPLP